VVLIARQKASKVLQPSEEAFDLPAPAVARQLPAVLGDVRAGRAMGRDELDPARCQMHIERIAVIAAIADEAGRQPPGGGTGSSARRRRA
jgi:hypothetical protein